MPCPPYSNSIGVQEHEQSTVSFGQSQDFGAPVLGSMAGGSIFSGS